MGARRILCTQMILLLLALCACGRAGGSEDALALEIRMDYLAMQTCSSSMDVIADYGQRVYECAMDVTWTRDGETTLSITAPEEIRGITAKIAAGETWLDFDGVRLETGALSPDGLSPVDCFPVLLDYATSGYIAHSDREKLGEIACLRVQYREPETAPGTGAEAVLWFDEETHALCRGELVYDGATVIQASIGTWSMRE